MAPELAVAALIEERVPVGDRLHVLLDTGELLEAVKAAELSLRWRRRVRSLHSPN